MLARKNDPIDYSALPEIVRNRHRFMRMVTEATMGGIRLGSFVAVGPDTATPLSCSALQSVPYKSFPTWSAKMLC